MIGALYHFTSIGELEGAGAASVEGLKTFGQKVESPAPPPAKEPGHKDIAGPNDQNVAIATPSRVDPGLSKESRAAIVESKVEAPALSSPTSQPLPIAKSSAKENDEINPKATPVEKLAYPVESNPKFTNKTTKPTLGPADPIINGGGGRLEIIAETGIPKIHWSQLPEHFPVPTESVIQLPSGKPKEIPKIQHDFAAETAGEKVAREEKRGVIKKAFSFSWAGYKQKAWMQDELSPVSGKFRNPFCQWGATLVDSLDTLHMMDLQEEFEEAVKAVKDIDFTTSPRNDIPLFETVIRYLGGLVAAYDMSEGAHRILLDKAVELADILMGAFDTPNRMPMTFYLWKPTFASQPHRAKTRVVLAELGSLSVEFTRLAQITKEAKYYDAVARITNEFELWQNNTRMPGLWPNKVDASGCKKPDVTPQATYGNDGVNGATISKPLGTHDHEVAQSPNIADEESMKKVAGEQGNLMHENGSDTFKETPQKLVKFSGDSPAHAAQHAADVVPQIDIAADTAAINPKGALPRREINEETGLDSHPDTTSKAPECEPQGLASPPFTSTEEFGIGGQADSTYEYLPKEYMLLGGLEEKYRTMYEASVETITRDLLYRTMIPDEKRRILHPGIAKAFIDDKPLDLKPEGSHLGCFAGGMYAVGAKIFGREGDMEIAKELTDGCIWAYEATATGVMPDSYLALQCPDPIDCPWNETYYHEKLDPYRQLRESNRLAQQHHQVVLEGGEPMAVSHPRPESVESQAAKAETAKLSIQVDPAAVDEPPQKSMEEEEKAPSPAKGDNNMLKPGGETTEMPGPVPEQSAQHSATLPAGGIVPEQPGPPSEKDAASAHSRTKRQLGDIEEPPDAPSVEPVSGSAAVPATEPSKTAKGTDTANLGDNVSWSRTANGTKISSQPGAQATPYTPPRILTHDEFAQARIRDERLPAGMTKITGPRYLLR